MVRDANLQIETHTTNFVASTAYSANTATLDLGQTGLALQPSLQGQVFCTEAAGREVGVQFQVSIDGGTTYRALGTIHIPNGATGRFAGNIGRELKLPFESGSNTVLLRANVSAPGDASTDDGTFEIGVGFGEGSQSQD